MLVANSRRRGVLIAFTGTDGAGKSTQASLLGMRLNESGHQTFVSEGKDDLVPLFLKRWQESGHTLDAGTMGLVMAVEIVRSNARMIAPLLDVGINVVAPRSVFCQLGFEKASANPEAERIESLLTFCGEPDLIIMLDVPVKTTIERVVTRGIDSEDPEVMESFRHELHKMASDRRFVVIDGDRPQTQVHEDVWRACYDRLFARSVE